jgi:hypothetical protein
MSRNYPRTLKTDLTTELEILGARLGVQVLGIMVEALSEAG